jgi:hypothetical protein
MKNAITVVVYIIIGLSLVSGVTYLIGAVQTQNQVNRISSAAKSKTSEPLISVSEARVEFMSGCDDNSFYLQEEYCGCAWTQLLQAYGVNAIINDALMLSEVQLQNKYQEHVNYCLAVTYDNIEL